MTLPKLELPNSLNYIAVFPTFSCQLSCRYCINDPEQTEHRGDIFPIQTIRTHNGLTPKEWITGLSRLPVKQDLPITFGGGEPTIYYGGNGLNEIIDGVPHYVDLLTNIGHMRFFNNIGSNVKKFQRTSPYPGIRVSWHEDEMNRVWGNGFEELVRRCESLAEYGFRVSPEAAKSDVGIYMVLHPDNHLPDPSVWKNKIPFEAKEFLGIHDGELYGTYAYPHSTSLTKLGLWPTTLGCKCLTNELLIDPQGWLHACHLYLYENWSSVRLDSEFARLKEVDYNLADNMSILDGVNLKPIGHILDPKLDLSVLIEARNCYRYGECVGCDTKQKRPHYKDGNYDPTAKYSSVKITDIQWPEELKGA